MNKLAIIALALVTGMGGVAPVSAENSGDEHSAQSRGSFGDSGVRNNRFHQNRCSYYRCGGSGHSYNRRYYDHDNYRRYDENTGAIIGGLAAGAIIGGLIASQPRSRYVGNDHVDWCYSRYRSYRAYDNSFQPNYGPRRQCVSP